MEHALIYLSLYLGSALMAYRDTTHSWAPLDRIRLNRALMNLLRNAGKFTEENGSASLALRKTGFDADTGIGMSPDFIEKLFTPFERERTSTVSRIQGTGLGMAITKNIIDLTGGGIEVRSQRGRGTEFVITLSLPVVEGGQAAEHRPDQADFVGVRVLLVEDNEINMEIAAAILQQAGFTVDKAENGQIAVEKVRASTPGNYQLILMDIQMPVMDGYAATRAMRSLQNTELSGIPIIAMSANAFVGDVRAAEEAGMNGHIARPIDTDAMMGTIAKALNKRS